MNQKSTVANILVLEDEPSMREMLELALRKAGHKVTMAKTLKEGLALLESSRFDLVLTDVKLPDGTGLEMITRVRTLPERPPILLMTAFGSTDMAVEAMKLGAFHYLTKPFKLEELNILISRALAEKGLTKETDSAKKAAQAQFSIESMIGNSSSIKQLFGLIERVSTTKTNVLITGESGTGKELVARAIHYGGPLKSKPFVTINCGAIPEQLMESEMFGHKRGSFTGAVVDKEGLFQVADQGTIFLDEVGELPTTIQVKLLRVLQDRSFRAVGGTEGIKVDVRVISATNRNLEEMVAQGSFREDLFYRLNVINIQTPTLRERKEDVPLLVEHFLRKYALGMGKNIKTISVAAMELLKNYDFPGNIRELQNIMERAVALEGRTEISAESLPPTVKRMALKSLPPVSPKIVSSPITTKEADSLISEASNQEELPLFPTTSSKDIFCDGPLDLEAMVTKFEKHYIDQALIRAGGVKKEAAKLLGLTFRSFRYRIAKYGMVDAEDDE